MENKERASFKFVFIPADVNEPIEEWEQTYDEGDEVECLLNRIKAHFRSTKPEKTEQQLAKQKEDLLANVAEGLRDKLSEDVLTTACGLGMVENVALLSNAPTNGYVGVNLYCDDEAQLMHAPFNLRASELSQYCCKPLEVRGDAFLARVLDNGDDFQRMDFTLADMSSTAPWVKAAFEQNERKKYQKSAEQVLKDMGGGRGSATAQVRELSPAKAAKEEGNDAFKKGDYQQAVKSYCKAVELDPHLLAARSNRAMALLKLQRYEEAEVDCDHVLLVEASNVKALLRRAAAREALQRMGEAAEDYREALELQPNNAEAKAGVQRCEAAEHDAITDSLRSDVPRPSAQEASA